MDLTIQITQASHSHYAEEICELMAVSAKERGTGIAKRQPNYLQKKIERGDAVIALEGNLLAGFCYIETWDHQKYVANSGLIVHPNYRKRGLARKIKHQIFQLSREKYPHAHLFGITTSLAVMRINSALGYQPVTFSELTEDITFWEGCKSCPNYDILLRNNRKMCLCTAMLAKAERPAFDLSPLVLNSNKI